MKALAWSCLAALYFFLPAVSNAQKTGRIECARNDGYVYLYSSMTTLDVRATLPCGAIVQITGRFEFYYGVISAKGDPGFVPLSTVVLLKDRPGTGPATPDAPARERMHYDEPPAETTVPKNPGVAPFTLVRDTPIRVKLTKTLSSGTAHVGDAVELEIVDDVVLEGVVVLRQGVKAHGVVAKAEPKKHFGHAGAVAFSLTSIEVADGEKVAVRCYQEVSGDSNNSADSVFPLASGKDVALAQNSEYTALVDGDAHLRRAQFESGSAK
jgi:hypothetical protein